MSMTGPTSVDYRNVSDDERESCQCTKRTKQRTACDTLILEFDIHHTKCLDADLSPDIRTRPTWKTPLILALFWSIGGRMSSGLRAWAIHLTKVSLGKDLVGMSSMLRIVGTWCMLMAPLCKWSWSHMIFRSTCLVLESFPGSCCLCILQSQNDCLQIC